MARDDGGAAFPVGISLRDFFAGMALSQLATPHALRVVAVEGGEPDWVVARTAYAIADAMLAIRKETPDGK
jgi:hypothetical protein